jgi:hypothetical protein
LSRSAEIREVNSMVEMGSINLVVKNPDQALQTYLKMIGTNNIEEVIKVIELNDTTEIISGYYLKTDPIMLGIFSPVSSSGRMAEHLRKYGEGIHDVEFFLPQDDFSKIHRSLKENGWPVSDVPIFLGKLGQGLFWLEDSGEQGVPVKFSTKCYHGFGKEGAVYLDTPKRLEKIALNETYLRPKVMLVTAVLATKAANQFEKQQKVWQTILSRSGPVKTQDALKHEDSLVDDGRGDLFWPATFTFQGHAKLAVYHAINEDGPIQKVLTKRGRNALFHNLIFLVTRDKLHEYWEQLEDEGFNMVDPKALLLGSTGNYFFFVHPSSTHGVLPEFVARTKFNNETAEYEYDWTDVEMNVVAPEINGPDKAIV